MGTDWVSLFDKGQCDKIRQLDATGISDFLQQNLSKLRWDSQLVCSFPTDASAVARLSRLREQGVTEDQIRIDLVNSLCVSEERLCLDYWGCYAEVFAVDPPGTIADTNLFPSLTEQTYLLLTTESVGLILDSLERHRAEVRIMSTETIAALRNWQAICAQNPQFIVAYFFDY